MHWLRFQSHPVLFLFQPNFSPTPDIQPLGPPRTRPRVFSREALNKRPPPSGLCVLEPLTIQMLRIRFSSCSIVATPNTKIGSTVQKLSIPSSNHVAQTAETSSGTFQHAGERAAARRSATPKTLATGEGATGSESGPTREGPGTSETLQIASAS